MKWKGGERGEGTSIEEQTAFICVCVCVCVYVCVCVHVCVYVC